MLLTGNSGRVRSRVCGIATPGSTMKKVRVRKPTKAAVAPAKPKVKKIWERTLTEKLIDQFCRYTKEGLPPDAVCDLLGISTTCFWDWIRKGKAFLDGAGEPEEWMLPGLFVYEFRKAAALYRYDLVKELKTNPSTWVRALATLERRDRKSFSRYDQGGPNMTSFDPDERFL